MEIKADLKPLFMKSKSEWREWLERNHHKEQGVWLLFHKKHTGKPGLSYEDAVEEALCFGWIDSTLRRIDKEKHVIRFSPRRKRSVWSEINRRRVEKLMREGKMAAAGLAKVEEAKKSGKWFTAYTSKGKPTIPSDLREALMRDKKAWQNFNNFAPSYQNIYIHWVLSAKREETRKRRINQVVERSARNLKPG